jgi:anti-sigma factor RsiW
MSCREMEQLLALEAGGDLGAAETARVHEHLAECAPCRALAEELAASHAALAELSQEALEPDALDAWRSRVIEQITTETHARRIAWGWTWAAVVTVAAVIFAVIAIPMLRERAAPVPLPPVAHMAPPTPPVAIAAPPAARKQIRPRRRVVPPRTLEPLLVRLETSDPDVIIYWMVEGKGD